MLAVTLVSELLDADDGDGVPVVRQLERTPFTCTTPAAGIDTVGVVLFTQKEIFRETPPAFTVPKSDALVELPG